MFRIIKIVFNAFIIVLAFIGFNAIGGQKYIEMAKNGISNFMQSNKIETAKKIGDFSNLHEEFQIDNTVTIAGYKAVIAEHGASGQKMVIIDSGKKPILTQTEIKSSELDKKLKKLSAKMNYQGVSVKELTVTNRGTMEAFGQTVPYAKFEAHVSKLPFSDVSGVITSVKTSDGSEKLALSLNDKKKYSQLITDEFYKDVKESTGK